MSTPRLVKVFLASSITELKKERLDFSELGADISNLFGHDEIMVQIVKCDNLHAGNLGGNDQEYIDQKLRDCDISLFVFKSKVGEWTRHEYAVARALQKKQRQEKKQVHRIFVRFLRVPDKEKGPSVTEFQQQLDSDGVFWNECDTPGEVKYEFAMCILTHLGITVGGHSPKTKAAAKNADELFAQYKLGEEQQQQRQQQLHQAIDNLLAQIPAILDDESQLISARIVEVMGLYQKADRWASKTDYDKEKYSDLLFDYAGFLYDYGMYYDAEAVLLRQIPLAEELYGKEHENTAASYNNIGGVYKKQGDYPKALEYLKKALAIKEKVLGEDHPDTATDYNNIGLVYKNQGDYTKALEYYGKALAIDENVLGKDHPGTATDYNNIGTVYDDQGDYPKALEYYVKTLAIREKVLGKDHPATATTYNNIGLVYHKQGDYPKALEYYGKALAIREKVLGKDHPDTASSYNNIGGVYWKQGDYPKALEYYGKALAIKEKVLGKDHPSTAYTYHNIGAMYYQQGKYPEALEYLEKALKIFKARLGDDHPNTKKNQGWIDLTLAAMG